MKKIRSRKIKLVALVLLVMMLCMTLVSCQTYSASFKNFKDKFFPEEKKDTIKIAVYEPITGEFSNEGAAEVTGIELAHSLYPTVNGKEVELIYLDNKSDMYEGEEILNNMLDTSFSGLIGSYGDVLTLVAGKKVEELEIPGMSVTSTNNLLTLNNPFYFTTTFQDDNQASELYDFANNSLHLKNIAIVRIDGDDASLNIENEFINCFDKNEVSIKEYLSKLEQTDLQDIIYEIKKEKHDSVFLILPVNASKDFINQSITLGCNPVFIGTRMWDNEDMLKFLNGINADSFYCTDEVLNTTSMNVEFMKAYEEKFGETDSVVPSMMIAFDSYMILVNGIENAYKNNEVVTGTSIRDEILKITGYNGASGSISYDGSNVASKPIAVKYIKNSITNPILENDNKNGGSK